MSTKQEINPAAAYLLKKEWSIGGLKQCPECFGKPPSAHGEPMFNDVRSIGHLHDCPLAAALKALQESPVMLGEFTADPRYKDNRNFMKNLGGLFPPPPAPPGWDDGALPSE